jgi:nucleotide-binding universal stress UspA family protein
MDFPKKILICIDGESHTDKAISWTLKIAAMVEAEVTALHVRDTYLKQFYNEIYAQGRREYLDHVDREIRKHAAVTFARFEEKVEQTQVVHDTVIKTGDPLEEIIKEFLEGTYDVIVVGGKRLKGVQAIQSRNIPAKLASKIKKGALFIIRG